MDTQTERATAVRDGAIGWLIFENSARLNAISEQMVDQALQILSDYAADPAVRVVILRGAGDKAFISGGDISKFEKTRFDPAAAATRRSADDVRKKLIALDKPVIAMIHGYCLGGGMGIALAADLRFGSTTSELGIPAALRGIAYPLPGLKLLVDLVGPSVAKDMMMSGRRLKSEEALRIGLLNAVHSPDDLEQQTLAYARGVAANAPLSIRASKVCIDQLGLDDAARDHAAIQRMIDEAANSEDFKESTRAFMEKRKPVFRGK